MPTDHHELASSLKVTTRMVDQDVVDLETTDDGPFGAMVMVR